MVEILCVIALQIVLSIARFHCDAELLASTYQTCWWPVRSTSVVVTGPLREADDQQMLLQLDLDSMETSLMRADW